MFIIQNVNVYDHVLDCYELFGDIDCYSISGVDWYSWLLR